jgi:hypothetical protein
MCSAGLYAAGHSPFSTSFSQHHVVHDKSTWRLAGSAMLPAFLMLVTNSLWRSPFFALRCSVPVLETNSLWRSPRGAPRAAPCAHPHPRGLTTLSLATSRSVSLATPPCFVSLTTPACSFASARGSEKMPFRCACGRVSASASLRFGLLEFGFERPSSDLRDSAVSLRVLDCGLPTPCITLSMSKEAARRGDLWGSYTVRNSTFLFRLLFLLFA